MPKPWAKYEIGFITHRKFLALNANAICLWIEGKDYADTELTDGLLPKDAVKHFRFYNQKAVALLTTSAGPKDATSSVQYAPLWSEIAGFGWKMHDYLDHNDCREKVQERIAIREAERQADRDRKAAARAAKAAKRGSVSDRTDAGHPTGHAPDTSPDTERTDAGLPAPVQQSSGSNQQQLQKQNQASPSERQGRGSPPLHIVGITRFKVWRWMLEDFIAKLGDHAEAFDLDQWLQDLHRRDNAIVTSSWPWLEDEFFIECRRRGLPVIAGRAAGATAPTNKRIDALMRGGQAFLERSGS